MSVESRNDESDENLTNTSRMEEEMDVAREGLDDGQDIAGSDNEDEDIEEEDTGSNIAVGGDDGREEDCHAAAMIEEDDVGGNENFDDEYGEEEGGAEQVARPGVRGRKCVRILREKEPNAELFDAFEFGALEGGASKSMAQEVVSEDLRKEAEKWLPENASNTAIVNKTRQFVCIDYPGLVRNKEKALATLGGIRQIAETRKKEGRLELSFRPGDPFCKPAVGMFSRASNLVIKCMRRKLATGAASSGEGDGYEYKVEVLGVVEGVVDFSLPADYQYLPVVKKKDGTHRELLSDIILKFEDERADYLGRNVPLFVPPFIFNRHERPAKYFFQNEAVDDEDDPHGGRKGRMIGTQNVTFWDKEIPTVPKADALTNLRRYKEQQIKQCTEPLLKLFEDRPVWTRRRLLCHMLSNSHHLLRYTLPTVAYYISSGPWRNGWCKFGYDPKQHPEAKHCQVIDFRLRSRISKTKVSSRHFQDRFYRHQKVIRKQGLATTVYKEDEQIISADSTAQAEDSGAGRMTETASTSQDDIDVRYQYVPWKIPPYRHMMYQACDVFEEQIQKLLHQNDGQEKECTERDGWCVPDFTVISRDIMMAHTDSLIK